VIHVPALPRATGLAHESGRSQEVSNIMTLLSTKIPFLYSCKPPLDFASTNIAVRHRYHQVPNSDLPTKLLRVEAAARTSIGAAD
jgi:hypothetical protein